MLEKNLKRKKEINLPEEKRNGGVSVKIVAWGRHGVWSFMPFNDYPKRPSLSSSYFGLLPPVQVSLFLPIITLLCHTVGRPVFFDVIKKIFQNGDGVFYKMEKLWMRGGFFIIGAGTEWWEVGIFSQNFFFLRFSSKGGSLWLKILTGIN